MFLPSIELEIGFGAFPNPERAVCVLDPCVCATENPVSGYTLVGPSAACDVRIVSAGTDCGVVYGIVDASPTRVTFTARDDAPDCWLNDVSWE